MATSELSTESLMPDYTHDDIREMLLELDKGDPEDPLSIYFYYQGLFYTSEEYRNSFRKDYKTLGDPTAVTILLRFSLLIELVAKRPSRNAFFHNTATKGWSLKAARVLAMYSGALNVHEHLNQQYADDVVNIQPSFNLGTVSTQVFLLAGICAGIHSRFSSEKTLGMPWTSDASQFGQCVVCDRVLGQAVRNRNQYKQPVPGTTYCSDDDTCESVFKRNYLKYLLIQEDFDRLTDLAEYLSRALDTYRLYTATGQVLWESNEHLNQEQLPFGALSDNLASASTCFRYSRISTFNQGGYVIGVLHPLLKDLLHDWVTDAIEVTFLPKNFLPLVVQCPNASEGDNRRDSANNLFLPHAILRIATKQGKVYAFDPTFRQFGFKYGVVEWELFQRTHVHQLLCTSRFGFWFDYTIERLVACDFEALQYQWHAFLYFQFTDMFEQMLKSFITKDGEPLSPREFLAYTMRTPNFRREFPHVVQSYVTTWVEDWAESSKTLINIEPAECELTVTYEGHSRADDTHYLLLSDGGAPAANDKDLAKIRRQLKEGRAKVAVYQGLLPSSASCLPSPTEREPSRAEDAADEELEETLEDIPLPFSPTLQGYDQSGIEERNAEEEGKSPETSHVEALDASNVPRSPSPILQPQGTPGTEVKTQEESDKAHETFADSTPGTSQTPPPIPDLPATSQATQAEQDRTPETGLLLLESSSGASEQQTTNSISEQVAQWLHLTPYTERDNEAALALTSVWEEVLLADDDDLDVDASLYVMAERHGLMGPLLEFTEDF